MEKEVFNPPFQLSTYMVDKGFILHRQGLLQIEREKKGEHLKEVGEEYMTREATKKEIHVANKHLKYSNSLEIQEVQNNEWDLIFTYQVDKHFYNIHFCSGKSSTWIKALQYSCFSLLHFSSLIKKHNLQ